MCHVHMHAFLTWQIAQIEVITGDLECPESHKHFPITKGVPNMLLADDE